MQYTYIRSYINKNVSNKALDMLIAVGYHGIPSEIPFIMNTPHDN